MTTATPTEKPCTGCGVQKPLTEYHRDARSKDGHIARCKKCTLARQKAYYERVAAERVEPAPTDAKACTGCGVQKPLTEYHRDASRRDGHKARCKQCAAARVRAYYEANREKIAVRDRAYYEANREKIAVRDKAYREANAEQIAARARAYYEANKEQIAARKKAWYRANRDKDLARVRAYHAERWANDPEYRARRYATKTRRERLLAEAKQEPYTRQEIFERDGWICGICDGPVDGEVEYPHSGYPSIDHVIPLSRGGDDTPANVRLVHLGCNVARGARIEDEDLEVAA